MEAAIEHRQVPQATSCCLFKTTCNILSLLVTTCVWFILEYKYAKTHLKTFDLFNETQSSIA
jgi:hypothetical protein